MSAWIGWILIWLLASRAGTAAAAVLSRTRHVWHHWLLKTALPKLARADLKALDALMHDTPDPARLAYSMALAHLDSDSPDAAANALACLRTAADLGFEGSERILLYRAVLAARRGDEAEAAALRRQLDPGDFSTAEWSLLDAATGRPA